jgi:hypothetical protein
VVACLTASLCTSKFLKQGQTFVVACFTASLCTSKFLLQGQTFVVACLTASLCTSKFLQQGQTFVVACLTACVAKMYTGSPASCCPLYSRNTPGLPAAQQQSVGSADCTAGTHRVCTLHSSRA